jgi:hypothetical protein
LRLKAKFDALSPNAQVCYTMFYYNNPADSHAKSGFGCYTQALTQKIYKDTTDTGATRFTNSTISQSSTKSGGTSLLPGQGTAAPASATGLGAQQTDTSSGSHSSNAGLIAGVTIGSIVGLGIIAGIAFWMWWMTDRRKRDAARGDAHGAAGQPMQYVYVPHQGQPQYQNQHGEPEINMVREMEVRPAEMQAGDMRAEMGT